MKVLIADDNKSIRMLLDKLLSRWGYEVVSAPDGNTAMDILTKPDSPQIAILDWNMPGKSGVEICEESEKLNLSSYRILLTAKNENEDIMYALDRGAHDFQSKPIVPGILKSRIAVGKRLVKAREDVMRSERLAAVGSLVAGVAHHFNNLNMPILMFSSSILKKEDLDAKTRKKVEKINSAARQAGALTERLMHIASDKKQKKVLTNMNQLAMEAMEIKTITFKNRGILVDTEFGQIPDVPVVAADINHVISNFLGNACDALVSAKKKRITVKTGWENGRVYISVHDTGCGIAPEKLQKIFTPFFTEKGEFAEKDSPLKAVKGTGIGLYAAKNIATDHDGEITVESSPDEGSTFSLWLPVTANTTDRTSDTAPKDIIHTSTTAKTTGGLIPATPVSEPV